MHQRALVPTGRCNIARIPDELLCRILGYLAPQQIPYYRIRYEQFLPLSLVCRRWERIYSAFFYRNIDLGFFEWQEPRRIRQLEATLRQRPDLCDAVRMIGYHHDHPLIHTCEMIANIITYCKGLRRLELHTDLAQFTWIILNAARKAPLAALKLSGCEGGPSLRLILKYFSLPTLKEISLNGYGLGDENWVRARSSSDNGHVDLRLLSSASPCNVTTMELIQPCAPAHVTKSFLQWPACLKSLIMRRCWSAEYSVNAVQGILDDHRYTLEHISISEIDGGIDYIPDFSSFTSLESLQIHGHNLFAEAPWRAATKLNAPKLRHLRISFDPEDQYEASYTDFESDQIDWLEDFVGYMKPTTNSLETVFVEFDPDVSMSDLDWFEYATWPWSYIDQAVGLFADHNITMTYTQPRYSKWEWDRAIEWRNDKTVLGSPEWSE